MRNVTRNDTNRLKPSKQSSEHVLVPLSTPYATPCGEMDLLFAALDRVNIDTNPRTARLLASSLRKKSQKVVEEAAEVALESVRNRNKTTIKESADLLYHLVVLWHECGIKPTRVWAEMHERADRCGIAEKLPKLPSRLPAP